MAEPKTPAPTHVPVAYPSVDEGWHSGTHFVQALLGQEDLSVGTTVAHGWVATGAGLAIAFPPDLAAKLSEKKIVLTAEERAAFEQFRGMQGVDATKIDFVALLKLVLPILLKLFLSVAVVLALVLPGRAAEQAPPVPQTTLTLPKVAGSDCGCGGHGDCECGPSCACDPFAAFNAAFDKALASGQPLIVTVSRNRPDLAAEAPNWLHAHVPSFPAAGSNGVLVLRRSSGRLYRAAELPGTPTPAEVIAATQRWAPPQPRPVFFQPPPMRFFGGFGGGGCGSRG